jgi:hypothetical protein
VVSTVSGYAVRTDVVSAVSGYAVCTDVVSAISGYAVRTDVVSAISGYAVCTDVISAVSCDTGVVMVNQACVSKGWNSERSAGQYRERQAENQFGSFHVGCSERF